MKPLQILYHAERVAVNDKDWELGLLVTTTSPMHECFDFAAHIPARAIESLRRQHNPYSAGYSVIRLWSSKELEVHMPVEELWSRLNPARPCPEIGTDFVPAHCECWAQ